MKSIIRAVLLILIISTHYIIGSQLTKALAEQHQQTLDDLARLRTAKHEKILIALGRKKPVEPTVPHITHTHEIEKPACDCLGCFSRMCKLGWSFFCCIIPRQN